MTRRRKVILWIVGGVVAVVGGLALAIVLSSPKPVELTLPVETKEIPAGWLEAEVAEAPESAGDRAAESAEIAATDLPAEPVPPETNVPPEPVVSTGRLTMVGDGKPFGEEAYELTVSGDRTILHSSGRFWFKVVLATVQLAFEQTYEADGNLRPVLYSAEFDAPLGFDRTIRATVEEDLVSVEGSDGEKEIPIDPERTFTLGTFSTYILLPRLYRLASEEGSATFDVLAFGGPPDRNADEIDALPTMTLEQSGTATLVADNVRFRAERYVVTSNLGQSELYARGDEFLAFRSTGEDSSLWVYRSDFFPDGVEVAAASPAP